MTEGPFSLDPMGTVTFRLEDGKTNTWRRPKLWQYREMRNLLEQISKESQRYAARLSELSEMAEADSKLDADKREHDDQWYIEQVRELSNENAERTIPWMQKADELLGDGSIAKLEPDEWEAWLSNATLPNQILSHWRNVPKAPGAAGTNSPKLKSSS